MWNVTAFIRILIGASIPAGLIDASLAIGLVGGNRLLRIGGFVLLVGLVLFCGDLLARDFLGGRLVPFAAPVGGSLLILGWLVVAASALIRSKA